MALFRQGIIGYRLSLSGAPTYGTIRLGKGENDKNMNPIFFIDFYKAGHIDQYPPDTTQVWSNWTPRSTRVEGKHRVVNAGLTYFCKEYLLRRFTEDFFSVPVRDVIAQHRDVMKTCLGIKDPRTDHIEKLHGLGYLPLCIYSLPEGFSVRLNVPPIIITNTHPDFFWLPNYFETLMSAVLWKISTSATTAQRFRKVCMKWAKAAGEKDFGFVDWQCHDFSMRGMSGIEDAILSGLGHLMSFSGTDTVPAILAAQKYYGATLGVGGSVPATEHSVMSAYGKDNEFETFRRLIEEVYPSGIISIVSDTWDLWEVLTRYVPLLKKRIQNRDGKIVIRPDSGDPVKIVLGDPAYESVAHNYGELHRHPASVGAMRLLSEALGTHPGDGLPLINNGGLIYGDGISVDRCDDILGGIVTDLKLSPYNMVFGVGSYTYEYVTRDTYGWAMKATAVRRNGKVIPIYKKPVTDSGGKFSHCGILAAYRTETSTDDRPDHFLMQDCTEDQLNNCSYEKVFCDGELLIDPSFDTIRKRVRTV